MLPRKRRLSRQAFSRFFSVGKRYHTPLCTYIVAPAEAFYGSVVVSKKVARRAVDRNTIRRRFYAILRQHHSGMHLTGAYICLVKSGSMTATSNDIQDDMMSVIQKVVTSTP